MDIENIKKLNYEKFRIKNKKLLILIFFILVYFYYNKNLNFYHSQIKKYYSKIQLDLNLSFIKNLKNEINIGLYSYSLKNGGRARLTSTIN